MLKTYLTFALLLFPLAVNAGWQDMDKKPIPDQDFIKSNGIFGAHLILTLNDKEILENWKSLKEPVRLETSSQIKKNQPISAFIIFSGCTQDQSGHCNVGVKYKVIAPNQTIYADTPESEIWQNKPALPVDRLQLGASKLTIIIEEKDLVGKYLVHAYITDNVANKTLELKSYFIAEK